MNAYPVFQTKLNKVQPSSPSLNSCIDFKRYVLQNIKQVINFKSTKLVVIKILVLEDDRLFNKAISFSLENESHIVFSYFNGNEAELILEEQHVDLIISDLITPQRTRIFF